MKFSLARPALALAVAAMLASCGGGGKATYPISVTVRNLNEPGLILSTNGMDVPVMPNNPVSDVKLTFPNQIEYGQTYDVIPKGYVANGALGAQPEHQTCSPSTQYPTNFLPSGTAGQLAQIQIYYDCAPNPYVLHGTVTGLTADGLTLTNGSNGPVAVVANATTFDLSPIAFNQPYGISVLTQPTGLTCTVTGGNSPLHNGSGTMDEAATKAGGVKDLALTCVPNTTTSP
jgi:hypothetical protein